MFAAGEKSVKQEKNCKKFLPLEMKEVKAFLGGKMN